MHAHLKTLATAVLATALATGLGAAPAASAFAPVTRDTKNAVGPLSTQLAQPLTATEIPVPTMSRVLEHLASVPARTPRQPLGGQVAGLRERLTALGRQQVGDAYRAGSSGPNAFDCSGLTRYVFKQITGRNLPHYSGAQYKMAKKVSRRNAQPGDLVFFLRGSAHHVGLYLGDGKMVHAVGRGKRVRVQSIFGPWYTRHYSGLGRILPA